MKKTLVKRLNFLLLLMGIWLTGQQLMAQPYTRQGYSETGKASFYANEFHGRKTASGEKFNMYAMTAAHPKIPFNSIIKVTNLKNGKWVTLRVNDRGPFSPSRIVDVSKAAALKLDMVNDGIAEVKLELLRVGGEANDPSASGVDETVVDINKPAPAAENKPVAKKEEKKTEKKEKKASGKKDMVKKPSPTPSETEIITKQLVDPKTNPIDKVIKPVGTYSVYGYVKVPKGFGIQIGTYSDVENAAELGREAIKNGLEEIYIQAGFTNGVAVYRVIYGAEKSEKAAREELIEDAIEAGYPGAFVKSHF